MKHKNLLFLFLFIIFVALAVWQISGDGSGVRANSNNLKNIEPADKIVKIEITPNSTYGQLMDQAGINPAVSGDILAIAKDIYDLFSIRVGRFLYLHYDKETDVFKQLVYQIDSEEELYVSLVSCPADQEAAATNTEEIINQNCWQAERREIDYELKERTVGGTLESSLYQWALDNDVDERVIIDLADAFQWTIDFAMDPRVGDTFKFIYMERYRDGQYIMPGQILAAKYVNAGEDYRIYYFEEDKDNQGFFDPEGNSVRKELLKAPIQFRYISSGYTTGNRVVMEIGLSGPHRAIDYAAPIGTPIRAVGDGTVTFAGWNSGGYGYLTSIRHNSTYSTNYAHQSKIIVRAGQKVKQGEIIGYVGSTGYSTGPHLHYELVKYGTKINPLTEDLPPGEPIKEENRQRYFDQISEFQEKLN